MCFQRAKRTVIHSYSINQTSWENNVYPFSVIVGSSPCPERTTSHIEQFKPLFFLSLPCLILMQGELFAMRWSYFSARASSDVSSSM